MVWYYLIRRTHRHTHTHIDTQATLKVSFTSHKRTGRVGRPVVEGRGGEEGVSCVEYWGRHYQLEIRQKRTTTKQYTHAHGGLSVCVCNTNKLIPTARRKFRLTRLIWNNVYHVCVCVCLHTHLYIDSERCLCVRVCVCVPAILVMFWVKNSTKLKFDIEILFRSVPRSLSLSRSHALALSLAPI